MGFCLLNNVAITVKALLASGRAQKILIVDWDIHHGVLMCILFINHACHR